MNFTKIFKYSCLFAVACFFVSCSKDENVAPSNELDGLSPAMTLVNENHQIEVYTADGKFYTGYNRIYFQIRNADGSLINNATATWTPVMNMMNMKHCCPASAVTKKENAQSTYGGHIVFQMAGGDEEYWELTINYTINGNDYTAKSKIEVGAAPRRVVETFQASDGKNYVMAMVEPTAPRVAINDMKAVLYRMESMMNFIPVEDYKIKIDPRMPGMGNHTSPNNMDLTQGADGVYLGKLSLTMTGYWKINLQLENNDQDIIKGEPVTETNEGSSIYFELEF
ncbi:MULTISPECIES: FixH family protein [Olivibacter]|uniref:FixH family protein n=1 Tax=Olivibacter oleidegradans TaxID=760123 RepID=A0ABV6HJG7_9SPHI|nr:FixH family protein [Olivibacter jilunii]